jgi:hypothetical protein
MSQKKITRKERWSLAGHEATHAVLGTRYGETYECRTIDADGNGSGHGNVWINKSERRRDRYGDTEAQMTSWKVVITSQRVHEIEERKWLTRKFRPDEIAH